MLDIGTPKGGIVWDDHTGAPSIHSEMMANYMQSKAGITFLAHEYAKKLGDKGIVSTSLNPGNLRTDLQRHLDSISGFLVVS